MMRETFVVGHRNPDTDSICSAVAYSNLKNKVADGRFCAKRAGNVNGETQFVLDHFGINAPEYLSDVRPRLSDLSLHKVDGITSDTSLKAAGDTMKNQGIVSLPILNGKKLEGLITISDIAYSDMDVFDNEILAKAKTPYKNIVEVLEGELIVGDDSEVVSSGKITVSAASIQKMETFVGKDDIVILANRDIAQKTAIEIGAQCIVVCMKSEVDEDIQKMAQEAKCNVIVTPYDTFIASRLICQSIPVSHVMTTEGLAQFNVNEYIDDVKEAMTNKRFRYFPVVNNKHEFLGMASRRRLLEIQRRNMILVDHNEMSQAVEGLDECEIQEIIDHHRLGSIETMSPVFFRNQPVGCTATIITQMYEEAGVEIEKPIAGLLCSAILSDTLMFRSPTCTPVDEQIARKLAQIAEIEIEDYAKQMFRAGSDLKGKKEDEIFYLDYKKFSSEGVNFGVGQITSLDQDELDEIKEKIVPYMQSVRSEQGLNMVFFMLTNIIQETTYLLMTGDNSQTIINQAFEVESKDGLAVLPGVMSRKKQLIPNILNILQQ
jgi:manganese-dependent inorganic pyrophosphatase